MQVMPEFVRNCGCFSHAHYNASVILNKGEDKGSHSSKSRDKLGIENFYDLTSDLLVVEQDRSSIQFQAKMSDEGKSGKERRKASKPIMEKRRRARINESLNELKTLILEAMKKDNSCYSKLEKADILEMTVQHLKNLKNQPTSGSSSSNPVSLANYRAGFNQCASEITRVLTGLGNTDSTLRSRLLEHLATRCLITKPMDAADTREQFPQVSFPNQPILPKPPISVSSPGNFSFLPQSSPRVLPSTQYHLASYPLSNGKVAVLLPTVNPFLMDNISSSAAATQPGLIPVFGKDPKHSMSPPEVMPLGLDTRSLLWKPYP